MALLYLNSGRKMRQNGSALHPESATAKGFIIPAAPPYPTLQKPGFFTKSRLDDSWETGFLYTIEAR
ncbi:hypothetical protein [[Phormidium] sp. ETS-05]|uniref:hypothetical protein n=1 Tax=[Phormidium] sp. ETS-05 TaxID=222819 RepID=UPI0018EF24C7|nr:hypothetical protein [[Phormidium] sp. ETS-05]